MFPFWEFFGCGSQSCSHRTYQERRLRFLKGMRDELETRLAGLNAAIETIERQLSREESSTSQS